MDHTIVIIAGIVKSLSRLRFLTNVGAAVGLFAKNVIVAMGAVDLINGMIPKSIKTMWQKAEPRLPLTPSIQPREKLSAWG
jgi:hypothetical protein